MSSRGSTGAWLSRMERYWVKHYSEIELVVEELEQLSQKCRITILSENGEIHM